MFRYQDAGGQWHDVPTMEEVQYPALYHRSWGTDDDADELPSWSPDSADSRLAHTLTVVTVAPVLPRPENAIEVSPSSAGGPQLFEGFRDFQAGQTGVSYENLLLPWLVGAKKITIVDSYIRMYHQGRNLADLLSLIAVVKDPAEEIEVSLSTIKETNEQFTKKQVELLLGVRNASASFGVKLEVIFDPNIHDRWIETDHGWRIQLGKGLDIWEKPTNQFAEARQEFRPISKAFTITYSRIPDGSS
jgi:ATP-dependent Lon protease